jgi:hypothetical protein
MRTVWPLGTCALHCTDREQPRRSLGSRAQHLQRVGLQLHQQPVARAAAVRAQQPERAARVCRHGVRHLARLHPTAQHIEHVPSYTLASSRRRGKHCSSSSVRCRADHRTRAASQRGVCSAPRLHARAASGAADLQAAGGRRISVHAPLQLPAASRPHACLHTLPMPPVQAVGKARGPTGPPPHETPATREPQWPKHSLKNNISYLLTFHLRHALHSGN